MAEQTEESLRKNFEELLELVEDLTEELGTELELHYTPDELPMLGDENTVRLLVRASKVLRRHGVNPPDVVGNLLLWIETAGRA